MLSEAKQDYLNGVICKVETFSYHFIWNKTSLTRFSRSKETNREIEKDVSPSPYLYLIQRFLYKTDDRGATQILYWLNTKGQSRFWTP